ncbi:hypothetical protein BBB56_22905 [Candidatus Pantoea deserta]|uniref:Uncharacterized protein n=1 Tax=Candidatus Pantoea deserta TaxID=1869313 RepID=A0A3N4N6B9_9GAMM|nr:hypothetical protein [Pantoea deserta]RPD91852.1 hypothetical protein BBB56_22905 [Pantoea deserta]
MEISLFCPVARLVISGMTFQDHENIREYFIAVLHSLCDWPLSPQQGLIDLRDDLSHRNGYTRTDSRVEVCVHDLRNAVLVVRNIFDTAIASLQLEGSFFINGRKEEEREFMTAMIGNGSSSGKKP